MRAATIQRARAKRRGGGREAATLIPADADDCTVRVGNRTVVLTNLQKVFWSRPRILKGDLLRYYAAVSPFLLPHLRNRAMVMKRYPDGAEGEFFFMKRAPSPRPSWVQICRITHKSNSVIDFALVQDLPSLLWLVNLGCIDLNPWYSRCDDIDRPDFLHFDLDPVPGATFAKVRETALRLRDVLSELGMRSYAKTTGASGIHVYVPIIRGPLQKQVWSFAKQLARQLAKAHPQLMTAEYRIASRPRGRVLVDYNQNAWGRTLASAYSVRPQPKATVSAPITWEELELGIEVADFRLDNMQERLADVGNLWEPLLQPQGRFQLEQVLHGP